MSSLKSFMRRLVFVQVCVLMLIVSARAESAEEELCREPTLEQLRPLLKKFSEDPPRYPLAWRDVLWPWSVAFERCKQCVSKHDSLSYDLCWTDSDKNWAEKLLIYLSKVDPHKSAGWLWRFEVIDMWGAWHAIEGQLVHQMKQAIARSACLPPTSAQVAAEETTLSRFLALKPHGDGLIAENLSDIEKADLAYFYAAIRRGDLGRLTQTIDTQVARQLLPQCTDHPLPRISLKRFTGQKPPAI